jgi:hypothetical protein
MMVGDPEDDLSVSLTAHVGVPFFALIVVALIEFDLATTAAKQAARFGTHLCVLAIGATGAVLIDPRLLKDFGPEGMILLSIIVVLLTVALAAVAIKVYASGITDESKAVAGVLLGLFSISVVSGIIVWG